MNRRFAVFFLRFFGFRLKNSAAVFRDLNDICVGILDGYGSRAGIRKHRGFDKDPACDLAHGDLDNAGSYHFLSLFHLRVRDPVQTFQSLSGIRRNGAQRGRIFVSHLVRAGNPAGKGVFIHSAVEPQRDFLDRARGMPFRGGDGKGNGARLRHAQGRLHVMKDQLS